VRSLDLGEPGLYLGHGHVDLQEQRGEGGVVAHLDQYLLGEHPPQPHPGRLRLPGDSLQARHDLGGGVFHARQEQLFLRAEVVVQARTPQPQAAGDVVEIGPVVAALGEDDGRRFLDAADALRPLARHVPAAACVLLTAAARA